MDLLVAFTAPTKENRRINTTRSQIVIGRDPAADILLDHPTVSRRHARVILGEEESFLSLEDCHSANGTALDGVPLDGAARLHPDQSVEIGPFRFRICPAPPGPALACAKIEGSVPPAAEEGLVRRAVEMLPDLLSGIEGDRQEVQHLSEQAHRILYPRVLELLPGHVDIATAERITRKALTNALGLGPLEIWLGDPAVSEIMINGCGEIYLEKAGRLVRERTVFDSERSLMRVVERILAPLGRRVDETTPYVDGRLPDGSRINVVIPPISLVGPVVTIRKFPLRRLGMGDLIAGGSLTEESASLLRMAVTGRRNIIISGGTGTGKTTFLNILASFIPGEERVITIEDAAELDLPREHVVRMETRPSNVEGRGEIPMRDLVRNSLRMRPDRIIVGECRGGEAMDMLQAMNTGHEGSMTTCHANTPRDALKRIETMAMMSGLDIPYRIIREQVASAIHLVVQLARHPDGGRRVESVVEVTGMEGDQILSQELFRYQRCDGKGALASTGLVPGFAGRGGGWNASHATGKPS